MRHDAKTGATVVASPLMQDHRDAGCGSRDRRPAEPREHVVAPALLFDEQSRR